MRKFCILLALMLFLSSIGYISVSAGGGLTTQRYDIEEAKQMAEILCAVTGDTSMSQDAKIAQLECFSTIVTIMKTGSFNGAIATSDEAIAGVLANIDAESNFDPYITETSTDYFSIYLDKSIKDVQGRYQGAVSTEKSGGIGLGQWTADRRVWFNDMGKKLYEENPGSVKIIKSSWYKKGRDYPESITAEDTYAPSLGHQVAMIYQENHSMSENINAFGDGIWKIVTNNVLNNKEPNGAYPSLFGGSITNVGSVINRDFAKSAQGYDITMHYGRLQDIYSTKPSSLGSVVFATDGDKKSKELTVVKSPNYANVSDFVNFNASDSFSYNMTLRYYEALPTCSNPTVHGGKSCRTPAEFIANGHGMSYTDPKPKQIQCGVDANNKPIYTIITCTPQTGDGQLQWSTEPTVHTFYAIEKNLRWGRGDYSYLSDFYSSSEPSYKLSGAGAASALWTISWEICSDWANGALVRAKKADAYYELITNPSYDWSKFVNLEEAVVAAQQLSVSGYWTTDQLSAFSKMMELDLSVLIDDATRENLSAEFLKELSAWEDNIEYNKQDTTLTAVLRKLVSLIGILFIVWSILLYIAYWFDRINTIVPVNAVTLLTLGKLRLSDDERSCTYGMFDDTGKKAFKTVNHVAIVVISITAIAFGVVLVSGYIYSVIGSLVRFMTSFFK